MGTNDFTGVLPGSWAYGFPKIQQIDMHSNMLSGVLPTSWGAGPKFFPTLQTLNLSSNTFSGTHLNDLTMTSSSPRTVASTYSWPRIYRHIGRRNLCIWQGFWSLHRKNGLLRDCF